MMKMRILFVDDEPMILRGLRRLLTPLFADWSMDFCESGDEALRRMESADYDVIVSDMRMPAMSGVELLAQVHEHHPDVVRIILSGQADEAMILEATPHTHQFLSKPCDPEDLETAITRACRVRGLLQDERLLALTSKTKSLPSLPTLYQEICAEARSPAGSMRTIGEIIARDVGMSAKVLQLVNSAFFGLRRHVATPVEAATFLGLDTIKSLVLSVQVFSQFDAGPIEGLSLEGIWDHSFRSGTFARAIAESEGFEKVAVDHAFVAGILHEVGRLILLENQPSEYGQVVAAIRDEGLGLVQAEERVFGVAHAAVGAYLLGIWGFPVETVEAIAGHLAPATQGAAERSLAIVLHVANALAIDPGGVMAGLDAGIDRSLLAGAGCEDRLEAWREACLDAAAQGSRS